MWDRPALLNAAASALFAVAAALVAGTVLLRVSQLPAFELREVRIAGGLTHVTRGEIEDLVRREVRGSFFTLDLDRARAAFERLPWVRHVAVRRRWPVGLDVTLEEHEPFARWIDQSRLPGAETHPSRLPGAEIHSALVNTHGDVFRATYEGRLPVFVGPEGSAREIAIQYRYFRRSLAALGETPVEVRVSARRAWQLRLESGLTLALGRENIEARLARFVATHARALGSLGRRIDYVDLRYANGFAVRIPELRFDQPGPPRGRRAG
jgi:cell division protein FtsQ